MTTKAKAKKQARSREITLGNKAFTVNALTLGDAKEWRSKHAEPLQLVIAVLRDADKLQLQDDHGAWDIGQAASLVYQVGDLLIHSMDILVDALLDYMKVTSKDREWIMANGDDAEAMIALWEILQLAYPFGSLLTKIGRIGQRSLNGT